MKFIYTLHHRKNNILIFRFHDGFLARYAIQNGSYFFLFPVIRIVVGKLNLTYAKADACQFSLSSGVSLFLFSFADASDISWYYLHRSKARQKRNAITLISGNRKPSNIKCMASLVVVIPCVGRASVQLPFYVIISASRAILSHSRRELH